jgi:hypothetical protein
LTGACFSSCGGRALPRGLPDLLSPVASQAHQRIGSGQQRHLVLLDLGPPGQVLGAVERPLASGLA